MQCSECRGDVTVFEVPADLREFAPGDAASICTQCLTVTAADPANAQPAGEVRFEDIVESFPPETAGVRMALVVGMLSSLALNRSNIETLVEDLAADGVDAMLILEDLEGEGSLQPRVAIGRRRKQLEQLME
ncbi:DUF6276 family protein [Halorubellus salinus]|uniref:DUF6276 family protein n=1 Tax=Halorubellus salinus TaxID=755309 RepID=UPI001D064769|nr:DUF6276 family protein [Halorubellus salinus]